MMRYVWMILFLLLLSACSTPAERAASVQKDVERMIEVYGPGCDKLGFSKDTDPWRECILRLNARDDARYLSRPMTTNCVGHRGFYNCTSF